MLSKESASLGFNQRAMKLCIGFILILLCVGLFFPNLIWALDLPSDEEEVAMGQQYVDNFVAQHGRILTDRKTEIEKIQTIGKRLAEVSDRPELSKYGGWQFLLVDLGDKGANAFSIMGGFVLVDYRLMQLFERDDEIAFVLGHEVGHVVNRDMFRLLEFRGAWWRDIVWDIPEWLLEEDLKKFITGELKLSREQELQADKKGVLYTSRAGYDPRWSILWMGRIGEDEDVNEIILKRIRSTHPPWTDRILNASEYIQNELLFVGKRTSQAFTSFIDCYNRVVSYEGKRGYELFGEPINEVHEWGNGLIQDFRKDGNELAIMQPDGVNKAYAIYGAIWLKYKALAIQESGSQYPPSYLGYPVSDEKDAPKSGAKGFNTTGRVNDFQAGHIWWLRERDLTFETHGAIDGVYASMGSTSSWLGFPISDEYKDSKTGFARSDFEDGYITTLDGINYLAFRKQPTQPSITAYSLTPTTAEPGTILTIKYTINNPTSSTMALALGCSIQKAGTTTWINDPSNDKVVNVSPGSGNYSREFVLLSTLISGKYNVAWGLWNSSFTTSYDYKQSNDALIIIDKGTVCFFADLDCNSKVDTIDVRLIALHWDTQVGDTLYDAQYDFNSDGRINLLDVRKVAQYWGQTAPFNPPAAPVADALIAENAGAETVIVKISPSTQQIAINTEATFYIEIEKVSNLGGVEFTIRYDPKVIEIKTDDVIVGDFLPKNRLLLLGPQFKEMNGFRELTYGLSLLGNEPGSSGHGILAQITVKSLSFGITSLDLRDVNLLDASLQVKRIPVETRDDSITVLPDVIAGIEERATIQNSTVEIFPIHNKLLQNYPNPFNPETWIPFELAKDTEVAIRIFNIQGQLIRTLDIGRQKAGVYHSKDKSAYWDGKTQSGESAPSGIYFYTIQAGRFTASRKMILLR